MRQRMKGFLRFLASPYPWGNAYGLARTLLALGTALTIGGNRSSLLFRPAQGLPQEWVPICDGMRGWSLFCGIGSGHLELARWLALGLLFIVASGWRPRVTGLLHWYVTWSFQASAITLDGGDQLAAVLAFLLLPITLTDSRRSHWQQSPEPELPSFAAGMAFVAAFAIRLQVALVYLHAAVGKVQVEQWANGTALYYWFTDPMFGLPAWARPIILPLLRYGQVLTLGTWATLVLEFLLFAALVMPPGGRKLMLLPGLALHIGIGALMGLVSFGFTMCAALILYLWPLHKTFPLLAGARESWLHFARLSLPNRAATRQRAPAPQIESCQTGIESAGWRL